MKNDSTNAGLPKASDSPAFEEGPSDGTTSLLSDSPNTSLTEGEPEEAPVKPVSEYIAAGKQVEAGVRPVLGDRGGQKKSSFAQHLEDELEGNASAPKRGAGQKTAANAEPPSKPKRRLPLAAKVLIVLLIPIVCIGIAFAVWMGQVDSAMSLPNDESDSLNEALKPSAGSGGDSQTFYALIIGSDARDEVAGARSDVMMLVRVSIGDGKVTLISIPRDTMVYAEDGSIEKINAEYNKGPAATISAVSAFAGVNISHYVEVSFDGLKDVVDALGGVWVDVPEAFTSSGGIDFPQGRQHLDGEQALAYVRERHNVSGGDFSRARAQRQVVEAIGKQVLSSSPTKIPGLVERLAGSVKTDLKVADLVSYAIGLKGTGKSLSVFSGIVPSYTLNQDGVSYVATMYDEWKVMMRRVDAGLSPDDSSSDNYLNYHSEQVGDTLGSASNAAGPHDYEALAASAGLTTADTE